MSKVRDQDIIEKIFSNSFKRLVHSPMDKEQPSLFAEYAEAF